MLEPGILLADEPTGNLDSRSGREVTAILEQLNREGITLLVVTHDMHLAADISDQVVFLHAGRIEEQGSAEQVFANPQTERLQQFLDAAIKRQPNQRET